MGSGGGCKAQAGHRHATEESRAAGDMTDSTLKKEVRRWQVVERSSWQLTTIRGLRTIYRVAWRMPKASLNSCSPSLFQEIRTFMDGEATIKTVTDGLHWLFGKNTPEGGTHATPEDRLVFY